MGDLERLQFLTEVFYSSMDSGQRSQAEEELKTNYSENKALLLAAVSESQSPYCIMYGALSLVIWLTKEKERGSFDSDPQAVSTTVGNIIRSILISSRELHANAYAEMVSRGQSGLSGTARYLSTILNCAAKLSKLLYEREETLSTVMAETCLEILKQQASPGDVRFALVALDILIQEVNQYDLSRSKMFMSFASHRRASNNFRDTNLLSILMASVEQLARVEGVSTPNVKEIVQLVKQCLTYDFMAIIIDETEDALSTQFPTAWKEVILSDLLQNTIWMQHNVLPMPYCLKLLEAITALVGVRRAFFDVSEEKDAFIGRYMQNIANFEALNDGRMNNPDYCRCLAETLQKIIIPNGYKDLRAISCFDNFLLFAERFTNAVVSHPFGSELSFAATSAILKFWSKLATSKRMYTMEPEAVNDLEAIFPCLISTFFKSRVNPKSEPNELDVVEVITNQTECIPMMLGSSSATIIAECTAHLRSVGSTLFNPQQNVFSAGGLAWLFYFTGSIMRSLFASPEEELVVPLSDYLSEVISGVRMIREHWQLIDTESVLFVEGSLLYFLPTLQRVFCGRLTLNLEKIMNAVFGDKSQLFQFFLTVIGHNMVRPLSSGSIEEMAIVKDSIELIKVLCQDMTSAIRSSITLDLPPIVELAISQRQETYKLRTSLCAAFWAFRCPEESYTIEFLQNFMAPIHQQMEATLHGQQSSPLFIAGWLRDLRGVSRAACRMQQSFSDFIDWVIERSEVFFTLSKCSSPSIVTISLLRFCCELVTPPECHAKVNLPTSSHSAAGVVLFKFVAEIIQNVLTTSITADMIAQSQASPDGAYTLMLKPLSLCMSVMQKCVNGDFVPFGAMAIYNDNTYDKVLSGILKMLAVFPLYLFKQYAKVPAIAMDLLRSIVDMSVYSPLTYMSEKDLMTLIEFSIEVCLTDITKSNTMIYGMNFLNFIASLVKTVKELTIKRVSPGQSPALRPTSVDSSNSRSIREQIAGLLVPHPDLWSRLINVAIIVITTQDRALGPASQLIYSIFEADAIFWTSFKDTFIQSYPQAKREAVGIALAELGSQATTYNDFYAAVFIFRSKMRKL